MLKLNWFPSRGSVILTLIFIGTFLALLPLRNQAFDDDFAYILTVDNFVKTKSLQILDWSAVSMVFQAYWGLLFSAIFGYSIKTLHLSSVFATYIGLIFFYKLLKLLKVPEVKALIFSLFYLSFPFVLQYTYSFMSDTFYISALTITLYFYTHSFLYKSNQSAFWGGVFSGSAILIRQIGIVIPMAFLLAVFYRFLTKSSKIKLGQLVFGLLPFIVIYALYHAWLSQTGPTVAYFLGVQKPARIAFETNIVNFFKPTKVPIITKNFIDSFIQRPTGYFALIFGFTFLVFLIFKIKLKNIFSSLFKAKGIIFTFLAIFVFFIITNKIYGSKFTQGYPQTRLLAHVTSINWYLLWPKLVMLSMPIWLGIFAVTFRDSFSRLFQKKKSKLFLPFVIIAILTIALYFVRLAQANIPYGFKFKTLIGNYEPNAFPNFLANLPAYIQTLAAKPALIKETFTETWLYLIVLFTLVLSFLYFATSIKLKKITSIETSYIFLFLTFAASFFITIFFAYFYWINYISQFVPFIFIFLAVYTRKWKISAFRAVIVIAIMLTLSLAITRNRYQTEGVKWEMANRLVEQGVEPVRIDAINWAWLPYWYFEKTFDETVQKAGGNKYAINFLHLGSWPVTSPPGEHFEFLTAQTNQDFPLPPYPLKVISNDSFIDFGGKKKIMFIQTTIESKQNAK